MIINSDSNVMIFYLGRFKVIILLPLNRGREYGGDNRNGIHLRVLHTPGKFLLTSPIK